MSSSPTNRPFAKFRTGERPIIPVTVKDARGGAQVHQFLLDTGNDHTIITEATRQALGLEVSGTTAVRGVNGPAMTFGIVPNFVLKIGNTRAINTEAFSGQSPLNLLGWKDVLRNFTTVLRPDGTIDLYQRENCPVCI